jgi:spore germination protein GerM
VLPVLVVLLAGCGLSSNEEPTALPPENLPPGLLDPNPNQGTGTTLTGSTTTAVPVYFLVRDGDDTRLAEVDREVTDATSAAARIGALLTQPPTESEIDEGITSAVPADLILNEEPTLDEATRVLTIDVSSELTDAAGVELTRAIAQIVYTATELEDVSAVRVLVDGEPTPVPDDDGAEKTGAVSRADYRSLQPEP